MEKFDRRLPGRRTLLSAMVSVLTAVALISFAVPARADDTTSDSDKSSTKTEKKLKKSKKKDKEESDAKPKKHHHGGDEEKAAEAPKPAQAAPEAASGAPAAPMPLPSEPANDAPAAAPAPSSPAFAEEEADEERSRNAGLGKAKILHVDETGSGFKLQKIFYELNGHPIYPPAGGKQTTDFTKPITIWEGVIPVGDNDLKVTAIYHGIGTFIFAYLNDMQFVKSDMSKFKVVEGQLTTVKVTGKEDSSPFTMTEDRPSFQYDITTAPLKPTAQK